MSAIKSIDHFLHRVEEITYTPYLLVFVPAIICCVRLGLETSLGHNMSNVHLIFNYYAGYFQLQMMMIVSLSLALSIDWRKATGVVSVGLVLAWLPPLIDLLIPARSTRSTYRYFTSFEWDFAAPYQLLGETIVVWAVIIGMAGYAFWASRSLLRALFAGIGAYISLQVFAFGWIAYGLLLFGHMGEAALDAMSICALLTVFAIYAFLNRKTLAASLLRFNHALPWGLLAAIGARMAGQPWMTVAGKGLTMSFAFLLLTMANDYWDRHQDGIGDGEIRPVSKDDLVLILLFHVLLAFWAALIFPSGFFMLLLFLLLGTAYHVPDLRFKRLFCMGYKIEGGAAAACFLFGAMGELRFPEGAWVPVVMALCFGGFALGSMFKDYKDIEQDRFDRVGTLYTRYMKKGKSLAAIHRFITFSMAAMFVVPPIWMIMRGQWQSSIPLFALCLAPSLLLWKLQNRKAAVEASLWAVAAYLSVWLAVAPVMA